MDIVLFDQAQQNAGSRPLSAFNQNCSTAQKPDDQHLILKVVMV
jgi:hypothetical protein